jgi:hypothetical protein
MNGLPLASPSFLILPTRPPVPGWAALLLWRLRASARTLMRMAARLLPTKVHGETRPPQLLDPRTHRVRDRCSPDGAMAPKAFRHRLGAVSTPQKHQAPAQVRVRSDAIRQAIADSRRIEFDYQREDGEASRRGVQPLGLYFWGKVWTLAAWCELRDDFRSFRVDRMSGIAAGAPFEMKPGRTLEDFLARATLPRDNGRPAASD